ncbi:MAG: hypothetical protein ACREFC_01565 [Stellaceae bacterium]
MRWLLVAFVVILTAACDVNGPQSHLATCQRRAHNMYPHPAQSIGYKDEVRMCMARGGYLVSSRDRRCAEDGKQTDLSCYEPAYGGAHFFNQW